VKWITGVNWRSRFDQTVDRLTPFAVPGHILKLSSTTGIESAKRLPLRRDNHTTFQRLSVKTPQLYDLKEIVCRVLYYQRYYKSDIWTLWYISPSVEAQVIELHLRHYTQDQIIATLRTGKPRISRCIREFHQSGVVPESLRLERPNKRSSDLMTFV
jgi:hypothetical protein